MFAALSFPAHRAPHLSHPTSVSEFEWAHRSWQQVTLRVDSSSTDDSRLRGALPQPSLHVLMQGRSQTRDFAMLPACFYFWRVTTAATAALQWSPRLERAFLMQATFWMRPRSVPHCFSTSARHVFPAAATSANLALHTSERSVTCSLRQVAMRRFPGSMLAQAFLISSAQAPNCAIALDTSNNDKAAQTDKIFSI